MSGDWRKLRNEEFHDLCCWPNIILAFGSRGKDLVSKHEGEKPFGILRRKWEVNINP